MKQSKTKKEKLPKEVTRVAWILVAGSLAPMLDSTMVNIALNKLMLDLHTTLSMIQWSVTGYVLAMAVAVPISGWLMDHFNGKKVFSLAVLAFGIFSFLSGISWNIDSFIVSRALQGFSGGILNLLVMSLAMQIMPEGKMGQLMAIVTTPMILGPILGPIIGGFIVQDLNWHWIFFVNVPVVIISILLNVKFLPDFKPFNAKSKMDWIGTILLAGVATSLIYGITKGSENAKNFFNSQMLTFCGVGLVLIILYIIYDTIQHSQTVMPLRFFKQKNFTAANVGIFIAGMATTGPMLLFPLFFQNIKDFTVIEAALILIPQGLGQLVSRPNIGRFIDLIGPRKVTLVSLAISLVGSLPFVFVQSNTNVIWLGIVLFIRGIGVGGIFMPLMSDIYIGIEKKDIPGASVAGRMIQNVGLSFGTAVISAVVTHVVTSEMPSHMASKFAQLQVKHTALTPTVIESVKKIVEKKVTLNGYQTGFLISCVAIVIIAIPALFLTDKKKIA